MFKWLNLNNFLDTPEEWHALVNGFCFAMCPFFLLIGGIRKALIDAVATELHYFAFGGCLGVLLWILLIEEIII